MAASLIVLAAACGGEGPERLLASAKDLLAKNDSAGATIQLKRAIESGEKSGEARLLLGRVLLADGAAAAAEIELRKASESGIADELVLPDLARSMLLQARAAPVATQFGGVTLKDPAAQADLLTTVAAARAQTGDRPAALRTIEQALAAKPGFAPALMVQARMKADDGDVDGALALLDAVLTRDPGSEQAGIAKGYLLSLARNDSAGALAAHRRVLQSHPKSVSARAEVVTLLFRDGKVDEARREFEELRKIAPNHPQTLFFDAQFAYVDKQYKRSRELVDTLLKGIPDHYRGLELAAAAEYQLGNDLAAQSFLGRALKVAPGLVLARQILAQTFLRTGQPAKAIEALGPLIEGQRPDANSLALAGAAYLQIGDSRRADAAFKKAGQLDPDNVRARTTSALARLHGGQADVALRDLQQLAQVDQTTRVDLALVSALVDRRDYRAALQAAERLESKLPGQPLPAQLKGQVQIALRDFPAARRSFETALSRSPSYFPAVAALAAMEVGRGDTAAAAARVDAFIKVAPANARARLLRAEVAAAAGQPVAEVSRLTAEAVRADPTDAEAHLALYRRHVQDNDTRAALAAAQAGVTTLPENPQLLEALGQSQLAAGEVKQAVATFTRLTTMRSGDARLLMLLAETHRRDGDPGGAKRAMELAVKAAPDMAEPRHQLALFLAESGRPDDGIAAARELQRALPKSALGLAAEGDIEVGRRNWAAASAAYQRALQVETVSELAIKLHSVLRAAGRAGEADRVAADWERRRPADPAFRFYLGDVATSGRSYAVAESHYRTVLQKQPTNALALNNVAWLLLKQGKPGALDFAIRADRAMPNRAPILDTLASAQAAAGQLKQAIATQERAVALSPRDPGLELGLARLLVAAGEREQGRKLLRKLEELGSSFHGAAEVGSLLKAL